MKFYKIAQNIEQPLNPNDVEEVNGALQNIQMSIANINQALETLEKTNVLELFERDRLISEIQSGNTTAINSNTVNEALSAMASISRTIPVINSSLDTIKRYSVIARQMNVDVRTIQDIMVRTLSSGNYQEFTSALSGFQQNLPSMSGTNT